MSIFFCSGSVKSVGVPKPTCKILGFPATTLLFDESTGLTRAAASALATETLASLEAKGRSLLKCIGVGGMDVAVTRMVVEEAENRGVGTRVPF
ncbi:hypothetical protein JCM10213_000493 [Rhodosporidiobolus nylandii]